MKTRDQDQESGSDNESKSEDESKSRKTRSTSYMRRAEDKAFGADPRKSNNGMRRANGEKNRNMIVSILE